MNVELRNGPLAKIFFGTSTTHESSKSYAEEILELLDHVWLAVKEHHIKHQGVNYVLHGSENEVFAGVEIKAPIKLPRDFLIKKVNVEKHAHGKHIGSYRTLQDTHEKMKHFLKEKGLRHYLPVIEIYGHWTGNESTLETEIIYPIT